MRYNKDIMAFTKGHTINKGRKFGPMSDAQKEKLRDAKLGKSGSETNHWKGGLPKCEECGVGLKRRNAKRCVKHSIKGRSGANHYKWKGGVSRNYKTGY